MLMERLDKLESVMKFKKKAIINKQTPKRKRAMSVKKRDYNLY